MTLSVFAICSKLWTPVAASFSYSCHTVDGSPSKTVHPPPPPQAHLQQNNWSPGPNIAAIPGPILGMVFIESVNKSCPGMMLGHHVSPCTQCIHSISEGTWSQLSQSTCTCELAYGCMSLDTSFTWAELKESPALQF